MKKNLLFITALVLGNTVYAQNCTIDGINYELDSKILTATVLGAENEPEFVEIPSNINYEGKIYKVTAIGEHAFSGETVYPDNPAALGWSYNYNKLQEIILPETLISIGNAAFAISNLESIELPNSLRYIESGAFSGSHLRTIMLPESLIFLGDWVFFECLGLKEITIPENIINLGSHLFYRCTSLKNIILPSNLKEISEWAFAYSGIETIKLPSSLLSIGEYAFGCSDLRTIIIPESVTYISKSAFDCSKLETIIVTSNLSFIEAKTFSGCENLKEAYISKSVSFIGDEAFSGCIKLESINVMNEVPPECGEDVFKNVDRSKCIINVPENSVEIYNTTYPWSEFQQINAIKSSVQYIMDGPFNPRNDLYDLQGRKILSNPSTDEIMNLPSGVYIHNGKKIMIYK